MNLAANHVEYWKTIRRDGYTAGFHWFPTFPSSRRLRFPWGLNKPVEMGWVPKCQREHQEEVVDFRLSSGLLCWARFLDGRLFFCDNSRRHFDKDGNEIQRREK